MKKSSKIIFSLLFFIVILSIILYSVYIIALEPYDELWNFQNVYKMYNGLEIYSDANVIITPVFYFLSLLFFKLFGGTLIAFRYFNIFIFATLFLLLYLVLKSLKIPKHLRILFISIIFIQVHLLVTSGANYNTLYLIFILLGLLLYLNFSEKKYFHFLQGFIIFLVFFTKQNIGVFYACSILVFEFLYKTSFSNFCINQLKKFLIFSICLVISLAAFYINGNLYDFINYAFGGIFDFGNSNIAFSASPYLVFICSLILILYFYVSFNKKIRNSDVISLENRRNFHLIGCITIGITFSVFPIMNNAHFTYVLLFYLLLLLYFLSFSILEDFFDNKNTEIVFYSISLIIFICIFIRLLCFYVFENDEYITIKDSSSPFYYTRVSTEDYTKMNTMTSYVKQKNSVGKNVIIIASDSAITMIPLKQSNKELDLVFNGNLGYDGENKVIEKIKNSKNTEFLIYTNEEDCFWQESKKVRNYIINNLNKTGEILNYSIYE